MLIPRQISFPSILTGKIWWQSPIRMLQHLVLRRPWRRQQKAKWLFKRKCLLNCWKKSPTNTALIVVGLILLMSASITEFFCARTALSESTWCITLLRSVLSSRLRIRTSTTCSWEFWLMVEIKQLFSSLKSMTCKMSPSRSDTTALLHSFIVIGWRRCMIKACCHSVVIISRGLRTSRMVVKHRRP